MRLPTDPNGVDLATGAFTYSATEVVVGQPSAGGLVYARSLYKAGWRDNHTGTIKSSGTTYTVSFGGGSGTFTLSGGVYTPDQADGSSLTFNAATQVYTYTTRNGVVASFSKALAETSPLEANEGKVTEVTLPSGEKTTYTYKTIAIGGVSYNRLQSVTNNLGYQLKLEYTAATAATTAQLPNFRNVTKVTGLNNAVDFCDPTADSCSFSQTWPSATYASPTTTTRTVTDTLGRVVRYTYDANGYLTGIKPPSATTDTVTVLYSGTPGRVFKVTREGQTWMYVFTPDGATQYTDVWAPDSTTRWYATDTQLGVIGTELDGLARQRGYGHDANGRLVRITEPEGNYTQLAYDARGNVTTVTQVAKPGSGLANIVTSAGYDATCANVVTCNLPNTTTDATGQVTNYSYDPTHGGVLSVTAPAPTTGAVRPQTRVSYTPLYAWYKNSGGTITQAGTPVYRMTGTSTCIIGSSCDWTANESWTTTYYGPSGVASNLLPLVSSAGSGDGAVSATTVRAYDAVGNLLTVDGPLTGSADTVRYFYDAGRQRVGVVGPDPDGGGALKHRAVRTAYNLDGQVASVEAGTVTAQTDAAWAAFSPSQQQTLTYDAYGRPTRATFVSGGTQQALSQYSYDVMGRSLCTTVRMNPGGFASPPADACTLGAEGSHGPDRITRNTWDGGSQLTQVKTGFGTTLSQNTATFTYTANGQIATVADALGGLTTYEYDGFDRARKTRYPTASSRTVSSTTDYDELTYDAYGRLTQQRRRDGQVFGLGYDALHRLTTLDAPAGMDDVSYGYDNLRLLTVTSGAQVLSYGYDGLGRQLTAVGPLGTVSYQYDLAGRRTRMTWPDAFYVTYDYDATNALTAIREYGATSGAGVLAAFAYDDLGRRTSLTRGNGGVTSYGYDSASRLISLSHDLAGTAADQTYGFTYNAAGQIVGRTETNSAYDIATPPAGSTSYTSNGLNQLTTTGALSLGYDARGNLTSDGVNTYGYDAANRMTGASGATLAHDPVGRLSQTTGAATTRFAYDGVDLIGEYNAAGALQRRYIHGPGLDEPLVWYEGAGVTDRRWLAADQLGSVVSVSNGAGASLGINSYDEYGIPGAANLGRFSYTGQAMIPEAGLPYYKARMYSPGLGRFMQPDPIGYGDGLNLYGYVGGDPIGSTDPSGLKTYTVPIPGGYRVCDPAPGTMAIVGECKDYYYSVRAPQLINIVFRGDAGSGGGGYQMVPDMGRPLSCREIGYGETDRIFVGAFVPFYLTATGGRDFSPESEQGPTVGSDARQQPGKFKGGAPAYRRGTTTGRGAAIFTGWVGDVIISWRREGGWWGRYAGGEQRLIAQPGGGQTVRHKMGIEGGYYQFSVGQGLYEATTAQASVEVCL